MDTTIEYQKGLYWHRKKMVADCRAGGMTVRESQDYVARNAARDYDKSNVPPPKIIKMKTTQLTPQIQIQS